MLLLDITKFDYDHRRQINAVVGEPFHWMERTAIVSSHRFIIRECSSGFEQLLEDVRSERSCRIELRPNGIICTIQSVLKLYAWVLPYEQLIVFRNGALLSLLHEQRFMRIESPRPKALARKFINSLLQLKKGLQPGDAYSINV